MDRAIALRYDESVAVPYVLANERGELAKKLIGLAQKYGVPVTSKPELQEKLILLRPGDVIPEHLYGPIAELFAFIMRLESGRYEKNSP